MGGGQRWRHLTTSKQAPAHGSGTARRAIAEHLDAIRAQFDEVVLVFDQDGAGQRAVAAALEVMPDAKVAALPAKDANECLMEGLSEDLVEAVLSAV